MKRKKDLPYFSVVLSALTVSFLLLFSSCEKEEVNELNKINELLLGHWNGYEEIDGAELTKGVGYLTFYYDQGITFNADNIFTPRYQGYKGEWSSYEEPGGTFVLINSEKLLLYSKYDVDKADPLEVYIVRLDEKYLWFRHSNLGREREFHLERVEY